MRQHPRRAEAVFLTLLVLTLAWGILSFGGVYPWAYTPLLAAAALLGLFGVVRGRGTLPRGTAIALLIVALAVSLQLIPVPRAVLRALSPPTDTLLAAYDVQYANAGPLATHPLTISVPQTQLGLAFVIAYTLLMAGTAKMLNRHSMMRLVAPIVGLGVLVSLIGMIQLAFHATLVYGFWTPILANTAPFGPFINRNHFAGLVLMVLPVALSWCLTVGAAAGSPARRGVRHWLVWVGEREASQAIVIGFGCLMMAVGLLLTLSRAGLACLAIVCLIGSCVFARSTRRGVVAAGALAAPVLALAWVDVGRILDRFSSADMLSLAGRVGIWRDAWHVAANFWVAGTGFNTYGIAMLFYQTTNRFFHVQEAHNDYLQIAAEGGLLIGLPALAAAG
ncbi:MAG: hypothetical protein DMF88_07790, partial [Acidobacteria bacterium]